MTLWESCDADTLDIYLEILSLWAQWGSRDLVNGSLRNLWCVGPSDKVGAPRSPSHVCPPRELVSQHRLDIASCAAL